jgi:hypothetical protein
MRSRSGPIDLRILALPPARRALLVSDAFEPVIRPDEWAGPTAPQNSHKAREATLSIRAIFEWSLFRRRYDRL